jgi:hypothetical protein
MTASPRPPRLPARAPPCHMGCPGWSRWPLGPPPPPRAQALRRPVHGLRRELPQLVGQGRGRADAARPCLEPMAPWKTRLNVIDGLFNRAAVGVGIHPGQTGNLLSGRAAAEGARAQGRHQHGPGAGQPDRPGDGAAEPGAGVRAARSPATTRPTSRWRTARTSPGPAPPRRCRWRSTPRWPSTACSRTAATCSTRACSTG